MADPLSRHPAFLNVICAVSTGSAGPVIDRGESMPKPVKHSREVRSMLEGSHPMSNVRVSQGPGSMIEDDHELKEKKMNLQHVQRSSPEVIDSVGSAEDEGITGPDLPIPCKDKQETAQSNGEEVLVPEESPKHNLQMEDLKEWGPVNEDCLPNTPFSTSAQAVLRQISNAYSGDAYFALENAANRERHGVEMVKDQAEIKPTCNWNF